MKIADILSQKNLELIEVIRQGQRYFVARVARDGNSYFFKALLPETRAHQVDYESWQRNLTREIVFLNAYNKRSAVGVPKVFDYALEPETWYVREDIVGEVQSYGDSDFLFKPTFFSEQSLGFAQFIYDLQQLTPQMPDLITAQRDDATVITAFHEGIFFYHLYKIAELDATYFTQQVFDEIQQFFHAHKIHFFQSQLYLSHSEPYASNIIRREGNGYYLVDWERVEPLDPSHDMAIMWIRAFEHPAWQQLFLKRFLDYFKDETLFWQLFRFNVVRQQLGNIVHFIANTDRAEGEKAAQFLSFARESITKSLQQEPFL